MSDEDRGSFLISKHRVDLAHEFLFGVAIQGRGLKSKKGTRVSSRGRGKKRKRKRRRRVAQELTASSKNKIAGSLRRTRATASLEKKYDRTRRRCEKVRMRFFEG